MRVWREGMGFLRHKILGAIIFVDGKSRNIRTRGREWISRRSGAEHVAEVQGVSSGQIVINPHPELVVGLAQRLRSGKCIRPEVRRRSGKKGKILLRDWIDRGQLVIRNRSPAGRSRNCRVAGRPRDYGLLQKPTGKAPPCTSQKNCPDVLRAEGTVAESVSPCRLRKPS